MNLKEENELRQKCLYIDELLEIQQRKIFVKTSNFK